MFFPLFDVQKPFSSITDYPCALQRDILLQGRLYLSESWLCFYSQVFRGTKVKQSEAILNLASMSLSASPPTFHLNR